MQMSEAIKAIKEKLNIAEIVRRYVDLKQNGSRFVAPCPFHQETKPSFSVDPEKGYFHCFGCQASGDIFEFYSRINGLEFKEALEQLAEEAGIEIDKYNNPEQFKKNKQEASIKRQMLDMHTDAARHFTANLNKKDAEECREYIEKRGISPDIRDLFGLGWARSDWHDLEYFLKKQGYNLNLAEECGLLGRSSSGNCYDRFRGRLIFPIKNLSNQIIAFGGRIIDQSEEAKYINSQETPIYKKKEQLFGLAQARRGIASKGKVILTEGYMDVLTLHQFGYDNGVGVLGTALTSEQIKRIEGFTSNILLLFDGDRAGRKAAFRSCEMLLSRGLSCNVVLLPEEEDIDSLLKKYGTDSFEDLANKAKTGLDFCVDVLNNFAPRETVEWAKNFLGSIQVPALFQRFATQLSQSLGIDEKQLRTDATEKQSSKSIGAFIPQEDSIEFRSVRDSQILIYAVRYPERLGDLRDLGADLILSSPEAIELWELLEHWGADEIIYHLNDNQKKFWHSQRVFPAAPLNSGDWEFECLKKELNSFYKASQQASLTAALAASGNNWEADYEYLRDCMEMMEKK